MEHCMNRAEAIIKICPIMTVHNMNIAPTFNTETMMTEPTFFDRHAYCQSSQCMAWDEDENENGYCKLIEAKTQEF